MEENLNEVYTVEVVDEDGNKSLYYEDMIIPHNDKHFAILVPTCEAEHEDDCSCGEDFLIALIEEDENGEVNYVTPEDEDFEAVLNILDEMDEE